MSPVTTRIATVLVTASLALLGAPAGAVGPPDTGPVAGVSDEPGPPQEIGGLRQTRDIPVRSVAGRPGAHAHGRPAEPGGADCDKDVDLTSTIEGVTAVAAQDNGICTNADLDTYAAGGVAYVVQAGGEEAAWTHTGLSDPSNPQLAGQFTWSGGAGSNTYTPDVKTFAQDGRDYLALSLERQTVNAFCGVVLVDVTDPANPETESQIFKDDASDFWCDVHNTFVEDADGDGSADYVYVTADARNDLRVLDISSVEALPATCDIAAGCDVEVGRYAAPTADSDNYVHDVTVRDHGSAGRRAYLSYWDSGLVVLDAAELTPGTNPTPLVGPGEIDPAGFLTHHAVASPDGTTVFIQDEFLDQAGDQPVQMWNLADPSTPAYVDGLELGSDVPANPAHNVELRDDLSPGRLFVGWYKLGLQAWDYDAGGFVRPGTTPRTAALYHQAQTEASDDPYAGAWGVRLAEITAGGTTERYVLQSDRTFGLIVDCVGCEAGTQPPPGAEGMHVGDLDGSSSNGGSTWTATVTATVHDADENPVADATVTGAWDDGTAASCTTDAAGTCRVSLPGLRKQTKTATFTVDGVTHDTLSYSTGDNHDPDGDSDGTTITVAR